MPIELSQDHHEDFCWEESGMARGLAAPLGIALGVRVGERWRLEEGQLQRNEQVEKEAAPGSPTDRAVRRPLRHAYLDLGFSALRWRPSLAVRFDQLCCGKRYWSPRVWSKSSRAHGKFRIVPTGNPRYCRQRQQVVVGVKQTKSTSD